MKNRTFIFLIRLFIVLISMGTALRLMSFSYHVYYRHFKSIDYSIDENAYKILCIGESTMAGHGASDYNGWYSKRKSMPAQLEQMLTAEYPHNKFQVFNQGITGISPSEILRHLESDIAFYKPDLIIMQIGNNPDRIMHLIPLHKIPDNIFGRFILFIDDLKLSHLLFYLKDLTAFIKYPFTYGKLTGKTVIWHNFPAELPKDLESRLNIFHIITISKIIDKIKRHKIPLILLDYYASNANSFLKYYENRKDIIFCKISDIIKGKSWEEIENRFLADGFHPNDRGYKAMAEKVFQEILKEGLIIDKENNL